MSVRRTAISALAAGLLLAGCSDVPEPRFEPTRSPSPTESSPTATPEAQSPEAFIQEWFNLAVEMQNTGDTSDLLAVSSSCKACTNLADQVEAIYQAGGAIKIGSMRVQSVSKESGTTFRAVVKASATTLTRDSRSEPERLPANRNTYILVLQPDESGWAMRNYLDTPS